MRFGALPALTSLGCLVGVVGCARPTTNVAMWAFDSTTAPSIRDTPLPSRVPLVGAINETLSFALAVRAEVAGIEAPKLRVTPWRSVHASSTPIHVGIFRMHGVRVPPYPGWHIRSIPPDRRDHEPLDALVPLDAPRGGMPETMLPGATYAFWVDVAVPKGAADGTYATQIELTSRGVPLARVDVELNVWPFVLPDRSDSPIIADVDHRRLFRSLPGGRSGPNDDEIDDWRHDPQRETRDHVLAGTMRLLQRHGLTPVLPSLSPVVKVDAGGALQVDWGQYDAVAQPCLSGEWFDDRTGLAVWPIPLGPAIHALTGGDHGGAAGSRALVRAYLEACWKRFVEGGWAERVYAAMPDTGSLTEAVTNARRLTDADESAVSRSPVVSGACPQDLRPYGWRGGMVGEASARVDVWCPPAQFFDAATMAAQRAAGRRTWLRVDRPPFSASVDVRAPAADQRSLAWQGVRLGAQAIRLGAINHWPAPDAGATPSACAAFDAGPLIYPGSPFGLAAPIPSARLKRLRRGVQDAAYVQLMRERGAGAVADSIVAALVKYAGASSYRTHCGDGATNGWVGDESVYDTAREIMGLELLKRLSDAEPLSRSQTRTGAALWRRFTLATRSLSFAVDGCRVRLSGASKDRLATIECGVTLMNLADAPIDGAVRFAQLPEDWSAVEGDISVLGLEPNRRWRGTLAAQTRVLPIQSGAYRALPIAFESEMGRVERRAARVACVAAMPVAIPPVIDGDLSDWPPGATNVADGFRLIARGDDEFDNGADGAPRARTLAIVARDEEYLYVGVNSSIEPGARYTAGGDNRLHYDDLIPVGDELIELLIDPINGGTRSPADLFRVVVKPSGAHLAERGIESDPPCTAREPWMADVRVGARASSDRWTVEVRIPWRRVVGDDVAVDESVWGFNVTRFDAANQEFSTWSGARGNAYDPLSLGNLYIPATPVDPRP